MDWSRKSVCDLAAACKKCEEDPELPIIQRNKFAAVYAFAKQLSSLPNAGGANNIAAIISMACSACQISFLHECAGRKDWRQHCVFVQDRICKQEQTHLAEVAQGQKGTPRDGRKSS